MPVVSMKSLLETGVHFGHRTRRWNPKMRPYIFTERNGIHILDLQQTIVLIDDAYNMIRDIVAGGGTVLFVGTKRQAQDTIAREAVRSNQPYINQRWLGGTLTNWVTIRQRINHLDRLETQREAGDFEGLKKRERLTLEREIDKLNLRLGGIRNMRGLPDALFIVDVNHEETAVNEANKLEIPIIGVVDTNCDPDPVDFIIPSNDDAIRAIKLIVGTMADAALEGANMRLQDLVEDGSEEEIESYSDFDGYDNDVNEEVLLGEATLAKIRSSQEAAEAEKAAAEAEQAAAAEAVAKAEAEAAAAEEAVETEAEASAPDESAADESPAANGEEEAVAQAEQAADESAEAVDADAKKENENAAAAAE